MSAWREPQTVFPDSNFPLQNLQIHLSGSRTRIKYEEGSDKKRQTQLISCDKETCCINVCTRSPDTTSLLFDKTVI